MCNERSRHALLLAVRLELLHARWGWQHALVVVIPGRRRRHAGDMLLLLSGLLLRRRLDDATRGRGAGAAGDGWGQGDGGGLLKADQRLPGLLRHVCLFDVVV
jgi:hypothetical protein